MTALRVAIRRWPKRDAAIGLPDYATPGAAGMDVRANFPMNDRGGVMLEAGARAVVPTGFALELPEGFEAQMRPRSGLAARLGLTVLNAPGTIDSDYRGEVAVIVINHGAGAVTISHGMRIAQMVVAPVIRTVLEEVAEIMPSARGARGFGSTGTGPVVPPR